jgi:hypothetical protein
MKTRHRIETGILIFKVARLVTLFVAGCAAPQETPHRGAMRALEPVYEDSNLRPWLPDGMGERRHDQRSWSSNCPSLGLVR